MSSRLIDEAYSECDPKKSLIEIISPGIWYTIHCEPLNNNLDIDYTIDKLDDLQNTFFCEECRYHIRTFCRQYPIREYVRQKIKQGMDLQIAVFRWTWLLHNDVNKRLGKEILPFRFAFMIYQDSLESCNRCVNHSK